MQNMDTTLAQQGVCPTTGIEDKLLLSVHLSVLDDVHVTICRSQVLYYKQGWFDLNNKTRKK